MTEKKSGKFAMSDWWRAAKLGFVEEAKRVPGVPFFEAFVKELYDTQQKGDEQARREYAEMALGMRIEDMAAFFREEIGQLQQQGNAQGEDITALSQTLARATRIFAERLREHGYRLDSFEDRMAFIENLVKEVRMAGDSIDQKQENPSNSPMAGKVETQINTYNFYGKPGDPR